MDDKLRIKADTIIRTIVLAFALVNQILAISGKYILPITDEQVAEAVTLAITIGASLVAWWKNNSFSQNALHADMYLNDLKEGDE